MPTGSGMWQLDRKGQTPAVCDRPVERGPLASLLCAEFLKSKRNRNRVLWDPRRARVNAVACLLPNGLANLGSHWQLMPAVAQGHKGASEWMTINLAPDLNQTASTKELHRVTPDYITPSALLGALL
jgi:hypothetical protein